MRTFLITITSLLLCTPAFAQATPNSQAQQDPQTISPQVQQNSQATSPQLQENSPGASSQAQQTMTVKIAEQIKRNLEQAGFKNIKLVPSAFIVRADDQDNNPVVMVVNPGSITTVSGATGARPGGNDQNTVGQGAGASQHQQSRQPCQQLEQSSQQFQ